MTATDQPGKRRDLVARPPAARLDVRHIYGPRTIGALLPGVTRETFRKRAPGAVQVMADWAQIVGPALSAVTTPRKLSAGTLTLACAGPVALELQHLSAEVLARINGHLGRTVVERLRFVQDPISPPRPVPKTPRRPATAVDVAGIPPGPLHDALIALGQCVGRGGDAGPT